MKRRTVHVAELGSLSPHRTDAGPIAARLVARIAALWTKTGHRMNAYIARFAILISATALIGACASTAGLSTQAEQNSAAQLSAERSLAGTPAAAPWPQSDWWHSLNDTQLDRLIDEALAGSPSLRVAEARTRQALAVAGIARSQLFPQINADAEITREHPSKNGATPLPPGNSWATLHQLEATLSWEIDFWGKNREAYESALGTARVAEIDAYAARLALSVNIAHAYVQLQRAYLQLDIAEATLKERDQIYALTRDRNAAGVDSLLEVKQAESALPATREVIAQLRESIELSRHELAALLGQGPDRGLAITRPSASTGASVALPSALPADLLGRRPDLTAQRLRIEALSHDIASARAEFYPNVNLAAFVGFQSLGAAGFLTSASRMAGFGPAITLPIFDAGRLRGNLAAKNAGYDIAVEQYNQMLADALRDVVDQITSFRSVDEQRAQQVLAVATSRQAYDLALLRYREGLGNYLQVLTTEAQWLAQQSLDADLQARRLALSIDLVRALGGGFDPSSAAPARAG
ncbi:MAG TPA: efflux transporter outer membrane subunit [Casimicrobiaceae bacterium]|nr:efflux transporter outer membrane subunit [Casimicrobiaceae bacterium]